MASRRPLKPARQGASVQARNRRLHAINYSKYAAKLAIFLCVLLGLIWLSLHYMAQGWQANQLYAIVSDTQSTESVTVDDLKVKDIPTLDLKRLEKVVLLTNPDKFEPMYTGPDRTLVLLTRLKNRSKQEKAEFYLPKEQSGSKSSDNSDESWVNIQELYQALWDFGRERKPSWLPLTFEQTNRLIVLIELDPQVAILQEDDSADTFLKHANDAWENWIKALKPEAGQRPLELHVLFSPDQDPLSNFRPVKDPPDSKVESKSLFLWKLREILEDKTTRDFKEFKTELAGENTENPSPYLQHSTNPSDKGFKLTLQSKGIFESNRLMESEADKAKTLQKDLNDFVKYQEWILLENYLDWEKLNYSLLRRQQLAIRGLHETKEYEKNAKCFREKIEKYSSRFEKNWTSKPLMAALKPETVKPETQLEYSYLGLSKRKNEPAVPEFNKYLEQDWEAGPYFVQALADNQKNFLKEIAEVDFQKHAESHKPLLENSWKCRDLSDCLWSNHHPIVLKERLEQLENFDQARRKLEDRVFLELLKLDSNKELNDEYQIVCDKYQKLIEEIGNATEEIDKATAKELFENYELATAKFKFKEETTKELSPSELNEQNVLNESNYLASLKCFRNPLPFPPVDIDQRCKLIKILLTKGVQNFPVITYTEKQPTSLRPPPEPGVQKTLKQLNADRDKSFQEYLRCARKRNLTDFWKTPDIKKMPGVKPEFESFYGFIDAFFQDCKIYSEENGGSDSGNDESDSRNEELKKKRADLANSINDSNPFNREICEKEKEEVWTLFKKGKNKAEEVSPEQVADIVKRHNPGYEQLQVYFRGHNKKYGLLPDQKDVEWYCITPELDFPRSKIKIDTKGYQSAVVFVLDCSESMKNAGAENPWFKSKKAEIKQQVEELEGQGIWTQIVLAGPSDLSTAMNPSTSEAWQGDWQRSYKAEEHEGYTLATDVWELKLSDGQAASAVIVDKAMKDLKNPGFSPIHLSVFRAVEILNKFTMEQRLGNEFKTKCRIHVFSDGDDFVVSNDAYKMDKRDKGSASSNFRRNQTAGDSFAIFRESTKRQELEALDKVVKDSGYEVTFEKPDKSSDMTSKVADYIPAGEDWQEKSPGFPEKKPFEHRYHKFELESFEVESLIEPPTLLKEKLIDENVGTKKALEQLVQFRPIPGFDYAFKFDLNEQTLGYEPIRSVEKYLLRLDPPKEYTQQEFKFFVEPNSGIPKGAFTADLLPGLLVLEHGGDNRHKRWQQDFKFLALPEGKKSAGYCGQFEALPEEARPGSDGSNKPNSVLHFLPRDRAGHVEDDQRFERRYDSKSDDGLFFHEITITSKDPKNFDPSQVLVFPQDENCSKIATDWLRLKKWKSFQVRRTGSHHVIKRIFYRRDDLVTKVVHVFCSFDDQVKDSTFKAVSFDKISAQMDK